MRTFLVTNVSARPFPIRSREQNVYLPGEPQIRLVPGRGVSIVEERLCTYAEAYRNLTKDGLIEITEPGVKTPFTFEGLQVVPSDEGPIQPASIVPPMDDARKDVNLQGILPKDPTQPDAPREFEMPVPPNRVGLITETAAEVVNEAKAKIEELKASAEVSDMGTTLAEKPADEPPVAPETAPEVENDLEEEEPVAELTRDATAEETPEAKKADKKKSAKRGK